MKSQMKRAARLTPALLATASLLCGLEASALAQSTAPADDAAEAASAVDASEEIIVTGSRVARSGFTSPTPTTVLGTADIERVAAPNVADLINQLPAVRPSLTPSSSTNNNNYAGGNYLDLRGLGFNRTLLLVDGKRFVPTQIQGPVDINMVPQALIGSIDIVTGGASAAWGSDAVAGVVNLRFDHDLEGLKGSVQGGITDHNDHRNYLASVAFGKSFAGDRAKLLIGAEIADNSGIAAQADRDWSARGWGIIPNPAYTPTNNEPMNLLVENVRSSNRSYGGLIVSGPLTGTQFSAEGLPIPFAYGTLRTATTMVGGDGAFGRLDQVLEVPLQRHSLYGRLSYELSDAVTAFVEGSWAASDTDHPSGAQVETLRIQRDNAFLPASIREAMTASGTTSFQLGRYNRTYGRGLNKVDASTKRGVVGLEGDAGSGWTWDTYFSHGRTENELRVANWDISGRYAQATDAVVDPATGTIVCRSAAARLAGCSPINPFGEAVPSDPARTYVYGESRRVWDIRQSVAAATLRGEPFSTWAGPVSLATGVEWRRDSADVTSDPLSVAGLFSSGNVIPWDGKVSVKEGFAEVVVPLAQDERWADAIELNLAARVTDYSTSGTVVTWKAGATWDVNDSLRLRATRSRDIRAPVMAELFSGASTLQFTVLDPLLARSYTVQSITRGNEDLKPEKADTFTAGIVVSPASLQGLRFSVDYYRIKLNGAILSLSAASIVERCYLDQPQLCGLITRNADGEIAQVEASPQNVQSVVTSGVDIEMSWRAALGAGQLSLRGLATYIHKVTLDDGRTVTRLAGSTEQPTIASIGGVPHWRFNLISTLEQGPATINLTARYVGGGKINNAFTSKNLNILEHSGRMYLDLSAAYDILETDTDSVQIFGVINNLLDNDPPINGVGGFATTRSLYDVVGRTYTLGLRFKF